MQRQGLFAVELPSRGLLYEDKLPGGMIQCAPMTVREERAIAGARASAIDLFDTIIKSCCELGSLTPQELLSSDRFFLLLKLRTESYGSEYTFKITCGSCRFNNSISYDLSKDLQLRYLSPDAAEPFSVVLPRSGKKIDFRLLRGHDETVIYRYTERQLQRFTQLQGDPSYAFRLARALVAIDGQPVTDKNLLAAIEFIENMIGADSQAYQEALEACDCGYDTSLALNCSRCGELIERIMPFTVDFFRPRRRSEPLAADGA